MKRKTRIRYTDTQKALMWDRWQNGESMHDIAGLFDRYHSSVQRILTENGGIRPRERKRSSLALTLTEREVISRGLARHEMCPWILLIIGHLLPGSPTIGSATPVRKYGRPTWHSYGSSRFAGRRGGSNRWMSRKIYHRYFSQRLSPPSDHSDPQTPSNRNIFW